MLPNQSGKLSQKTWSSFGNEQDNAFKTICGEFKIRNWMYFNAGWSSCSLRFACTNWSAEEVLAHRKGDTGWSRFIFFGMCCSCQVNGTTQLQEETLIDNNLQEVIRIMQWLAFPIQRLLSSNKKFWDFKENPSHFDGILYKSNKLVIPSRMRPMMLGLLHEGQFGIEKTRARARSAMCWPAINTAIKLKTKNCANCQTYQRQNTKEPLISHSRPNSGWQKIGADLMDYGNSKWLIITVTGSKLSSLETVVKLKRSLRSSKMYLPDSEFH